MPTTPPENARLNPAVPPENQSPPDNVTTEAELSPELQERLGEDAVFASVTAAAVTAEVGTFDLIHAGELGDGFPDNERSKILGPVLGLAAPGMIVPEEGIPAGRFVRKVINLTDATDVTEHFAGQIAADAELEQTGAIDLSTKKLLVYIQWYVNS